MLRHVYLLELRRRFSRPQTWIYFLLLAFGAFMSVLAQAGAFGSSVFGRRVLNGPYHIAEGAVLFSLIGVLITAGYMGQAIFRDFRTGMYPLLYTTRMTRRAYLGGRFLGALTGNAFILLGWGAGIVLGSLMPFLDQARFGPFLIEAYLRPYAVFMLPNLLFTSAIFFVLPAITRKILPNYVAGITLFVGYLVSTTVVADLDNRMLAALVDPFGLTTLQQLTLYWTVAEQNTRMIGFEGYLLYNRLIWLSVGAIVLAFGWTRFRFTHIPERKGMRRWFRTQQHHADPEQAAAAPIRPLALPAATLSFTARNAWRHYLTLTRTAFLSTVRNIYFVAIVISGLIFLVASAVFLDESFGTTVYPVTNRVVAILSGDFSIFMLIIIVYYSGELIWRERDTGIQQIHDALPVRSWIPFAAKYTALGLIVVTLLLVIMAYGVAAQTVMGYHNYEFGVYLKELFGIQLIDLLLLAGLAMFVQVLVNHKYVGYFLVIGYYLILDLAGELGLEHNLFLFGSDPGVVYSDMNGYGHFLMPFTWFKAYWVAFVLVLAIASNLFWVRGEETSFRKRRGLARQRFTGRARAGLVLTAAAFLLCGGFIYYNTNVVHVFRGTSDWEEWRATYERTYKSQESLILPAIVDMQVDVDIFPERRGIQASGTYTLVNNREAAIDSLVVESRGGIVELRSLEFSRPVTRLLYDSTYGYTLFRFDSPLMPGDTTVFTFDVAIENHGFENSTGGTELVHNGTFINNSSVLPSLGYDEGSELADDNARRRLGLPDRPRAAPVDDSVARMTTALGSSAWTTFEATVSTSADQIAIAPGVLIREWQEDGRNYYQYSTRGRRIHPFVSFISADYEIARDRWRDVDLEVYYDASHAYNVDRFMNGLKKALEYYSNSFGPYQFEVARIIEFPRYASFAQAFPNTMPYSESIGFIAHVDEDDPESIDYPFFVTAHEVAHQWWAHQVIGGDVQGSTMLSESLAEYSALKVLEHEYGAAKMRRFLLEELNGYLSGRQNESRAENPLLLVEGQGYIRYQKGALVFYALSDYIGEDRLNGVLREFVAEKAFQEPPFTNSIELYDMIREATPDSLHYFLEDAFETITLYDLRTTAANAARTDGGWQVTLDIEAAKMRADSIGAEVSTPMNDWIEIGVFGDNEMTEPLYLQKHRVPSGSTTLTITVDSEPVRAGIDPWHKLIDRETSDNTVKVGLSGTG